MHTQPIGVILIKCKCSVAIHQGRTVKSVHPQADSMTFPFKIYKQLSGAKTADLREY